MKRKNIRRGFTIVELVIVIAVIAILATTLMPTFGNVISNAKDSAAKQEAKNAYTSYMVENAGKGEMPELFLYKAEEGRVVAIQNGAAVGSYATLEEALTALIGEDYDDNELKATADGKLFAYGGKVPTITDPVVPPTIKAERPESGKEVFTYSVSDFAGNDIASIHLPASYSSDGEPVKIVIMNRGAGGDYTASEGYALNSLLLNAGYATLHVRGIPEAYQNDKYIQGNYGAPYGSPVFIKSVVAAYAYITDKYNIDTTGCAVFGVSCGGLQSLNLVNAQVLPIKVAVVDAPVVDLHNDCYFGGNWITGTLGGKTAAGVAWMYQFDHCDFEAGTYTVDGQTYAFSDIDQTSLEKLWQLNADKVEPYNAYEAGKYQTADGDWAIKFACPVKMWFGMSETTNSIPNGQEFIKRCQNGGVDAVFRNVNTSTHGVHAVHETYRNEMLSWIEKYWPSTNQVTDETVLNANSTVFLGKDGSLIPQADQTHTYKKVSDYIEIPAGHRISEFCSITHMDGTNAYCAFYDENKNFISAYLPNASDGTIVGNWKYTTVPPDIPERAKYIRVAFNNGLDTYSTLDIVLREYALLEFEKQ